MKMLILSVMLFITASSFTTTQTETSNAATGTFSFFRAHRQAKNVDLTWAVSTPDVVQFVIERSYSGDFFETAVTLTGATGTQKFKDTNVFPGVIYYRIKAIKSDGTEDWSETVSVRIVQH